MMENRGETTELKITGKTNTTGTRQNKAGESEDIDFTNYRMETAGGSVKLRVRCEDFDELRAEEGDVFELKASKAQTKLPQLEPKLAQDIKSGDVSIKGKRGRPAKGK